MKKKYIIGLGCSWTQGEGGYPEHIWKQYNGRVQLRGVPDEHLRVYEHENSWVNVLCRDHFSDYIPINLGARGIGNRAAVHQLYFCDKIDWENSEGIIILMMSGMERFDFFREHPRKNEGHDDGYSNGNYKHYKWRTMWPFDNIGGAEQPLWTCYARMLWSEEFVASEAMMALLDLQTFAKAQNFKFIVANGFNQHVQGVQNYLKEYTGVLVNKFDWGNYLHEYTPYVAFVQKLIWMDGLLDPRDWGSYHNYYRNKDWPEKYLTNCEGAHPTIEGYKVIAEELANFIKQKQYV